MVVASLQSLIFPMPNLQLELDKESRKFLVIATHLGLCQYTCLPFGIAGAPATCIFQQTMETMLQGLSRVACYLDDIIATEKSEAHTCETWSEYWPESRSMIFRYVTKNVRPCKTL